MSATCNALSAFHTAFQAISLEVEFKMDWKNGTGYFQCDKVDRITEGDRAKCVDDHGRRMILIGTRVGTIVLFERHNTNTGVIVANVPEDLASVFDLSGALTHEKIDFITGGRDGYMNINSRIEKMFKTVAEFNEDLAERTA